MNIELLVDKSDIVRRTQDQDVARVVMFVLEKTIFDNRFPYREGRIEYDNVTDVRQLLLREFNVFLSGFGIRVHYDRNCCDDLNINFSSDKHQNFIRLSQIRNQLIIS